MITLIADSNALREPSLQAYLAHSRDHAIALSDLALIEMRKTNALATARQSLRIADAYASQVFVLRQTDELLAEVITTADQAVRLIDFEGSIALGHQARRLHAIPPPATLAEEMAALEADAKLVIARLTDEAAAFEPTLFDVVKDFSQAELTQLRTGQDVTDATRQKLHDLLKETIGLFILRNQEPGRRAPMRFSKAMAMFAGRYSLCMLLFYLEWVRTGRSQKRLDRRVNDIVDMQTAAVATYFNGVLSADATLQRVSQAARRILRSYGVFVGQDWQPEVKRITI